MISTFEIKKVEEKDILQIMEIYNFHVENGLANFEENSLSHKEFIKLFNHINNSNLPFLVAKKDNNVIGFTYLNQFRNKSGYKFSYENSIYVDINYTGQGIGYNLLKELIKVSLLDHKIKNIIAVIGSYDSEASIKIHTKNGFEMIGTIKKVGYKQGKWLDTIYMQRILNEKN